MSGVIEAERFIRPGTQIRGTLLDPYEGFVAKILDERPRLRATRLQQILVARGYPGLVVRPDATSKRCDLRAAKRSRLETISATSAQVDRGNFKKVQVGQARRSLSCIVLVLSWSRAKYARFALDQTLESFLHRHVLGFDVLGGVPREVLYDNLKSINLERTRDHIRFRPRVLDPAEHYRLALRPARLTAATRRVRSSDRSCPCNAIRSSRHVASLPSTT